MYTSVRFFLRPVHALGSSSTCKCSTSMAGSMFALSGSVPVAPSTLIGAECSKFKVRASSVEPAMDSADADRIQRLKNEGLDDFDIGKPELFRNETKVNTTQDPEKTPWNLSFSPSGSEHSERQQWTKGGSKHARFMPMWRNRDKTDTGHSEHTLSTECTVQTVCHYKTMPQSNR